MSCDLCHDIIVHNNGQQQCFTELFMIYMKKILKNSEVGVVSDLTEVAK